MNLPDAERLITSLYIDYELSSVALHSTTSGQAM